MSEPTMPGHLVIDLTDAALAARAVAPAPHACALCGSREQLLRLVGTSAPLCSDCFAVVHLSRA